MAPKQIRYTLDDDTQEALETIMNWAQELIDLQKDDDVRDEMLDILLVCAERFNVSRSVIEVVEDYDDESKTATVRITVKDEEQDNKPKLTLVDKEPTVIDLKDWKGNDDDKPN